MAHPVEWLQKNERGDLLLHLRDGLYHLINAIRVARLPDGLLAQFLQLHTDPLEFGVGLDRRLHLLLLALRDLLRVHAFAMHWRRMVLVIHGLGIEWIADAGKRLADLSLMFGRLPQYVFEEGQIVLSQRVTSFRERMRLQHTESLSPSPVADDDPLARKISAQLLDQVNRRVRNGHLRGGLMQSDKLGLQVRQRLAAIRVVTVMLCSSGADESNEPGVGDVADSEAQQESIPAGFEFIALWHLVVCPEKRDQRDLHLLVAVVDIANILSLVCLPLPSFYSVSRRGIASRVARQIFGSGIEVYRLAPPVLALYAMR